MSPKIPKSIKKHRLLLSLPLIVMIIGTAGFMVLEQFSFIDALYFTVVTISTVGYGDIFPISAAGKVLSIIIIIIGIGTFLTLVTQFSQSLVRRGLDRLRRHRLDMLIGILFTEMGNQLLRLFASYDPGIESIRKECLTNDRCTEANFTHFKRRLQQTKFDINPSLSYLATLKDLLQEKGATLIRLIENHDLLEHESFAELLWAVVHLRDELMARHTFTGIPETDTEHLANDSIRAYTLLVKQWLQHMQHLKRRYPYLFSLALRTNPFSKNPSPTVR